MKKRKKPVGRPRKYPRGTPRPQRPIMIYGNLWAPLTHAAILSGISRTAYANKAIAHYLGLPFTDQKPNSPLKTVEALLGPLDPKSEEKQNEEATK